MIQEQQATVYYSSLARRRYFTKSAAFNSEARALLRRKYPTEESEHDEFGRCTYGGWHWLELDNIDELFKRLVRFIKYNYNTKLKPIAKGGD